MLNSNDLSKILSNNVFSNLQFLDLQSNAASLKSDVWETIIQVKNLKFLSIKNNRNCLKGFKGNMKLPGIQELNMENCDLQDEQLEILFECMDLKQIKILNISKNHALEESYKKINLLSILEKLILSYNNVDLQLLKDLIINSPYFKYLDISHCKFEDDEIFKGFENINNIETLVMQSLKLDSDSVFKIISKFGKNLQKLDLEGNIEIAQNFFQNKINENIFENLKWLSVKQCSFDEDESHRKDEVDRQQMAAASNVEYVPFNYGFIPFQVEFVQNLTKNFPGLEFLDISYNKLTNQGLIQLLEGFQKNKQQIKHLQLGKCDLQGQIVKQFINNENFKSLNSLGLRENDLGDEFILQMCDQDTIIEQLEYVNFSACKITENGFQKLLQWKPLKYVKDLRFSENVSREGNEEYLDIFLSQIDKFKNVKKITLGSGLQNDSDIPDVFVQRKILLAPFLGDGFD